VPAGARHPYTLRKVVERNVFLTLEELFHGGSKVCVCLWGRGRRGDAGGGGCREEGWLVCSGVADALTASSQHKSPTHSKRALLTAIEPYKPFAVGAKITSDYTEWGEWARHRGCSSPGVVTMAPPPHPLLPLPPSPTPTPSPALPSQMETTSVYRIDERTGFAVPADKTFTVPVKPGWKEGTRVTFEVVLLQFL